MSLTERKTWSSRQKKVKTFVELSSPRWKAG